MHTPHVNAGRKLPTRQVAERYGVTDRTIARWEREPDLNFPVAIVIHHRKYYDEAALTAWDIANAGRRAAA
jgi:DNA-binding transcriptional MerR regulator